MIKKVKDGYKVVSHQTGRSFGTYSSKAEAVNRLRQVKGHATPAKTKYRREQHPNR